MTGRVVDVNDFGADPAGSSDSTKAFQDALAYCQKWSVGTLHVAGSYRLSSGLDASGVLIGGDGVNGSQLWFSGPRIFLTFKKSFGGLRDLGVWAADGTKSAIGVYGAGDSVDQPSELRLQNVGFRGVDKKSWFQYAVLLDGSARKSPKGVRQAFLRDITSFHTSDAVVYAKDVQHLCINNIASALPVLADGTPSQMPQTSGAGIIIDGITTPYDGVSYGAYLDGLLLGGPIVVYRSSVVGLMGQVDGYFFHNSADHIYGNIVNLVPSSVTWTNVNQAQHSQITILS